MVDTDRISFLNSMAVRIRAASSDQIKLDALVAALENEARLLRDGPDEAPLTEDERAVIFDAITGDRIRVVQPGDVRGLRIQAKAQLDASKKKADEVRDRKARGELDAPDAPRPEPFRIGGPATPDELRIERGYAEDRRAAETARTSAKPGPGSPIVTPPPPVSDGLRAADGTVLEPRPAAPFPPRPAPMPPVTPTPTPPVDHKP